MSVAFWCIKLKNGKSEEVQPPEGYVLNVQQCALVGKENESAALTVSTTSVEGDAIDAVICTLCVGKSDQVGLNLVFGYDVPASFSSKGKGELHVSGYYQPGPLEDDDEMDEYGEMGEGEDDDEDDDSDSDDDVEGDEEARLKAAQSAIAKLGAARGKDPLMVTGSKATKSAPMEDADEDSEEDSDDDDDDDEAVDEAFIMKMIAKTAAEGRVQQLEEEEDSDDSEEEEEVEKPPMKSAKVTPKGTVTPTGQKTNPKQQQQSGNNKPKTPTHQTGGKSPAGNPASGSKGKHNVKSGDKRKR